MLRELFENGEGRKIEKMLKITFAGTTKKMLA